MDAAVTRDEAYSVLFEVTFTKGGPRTRLILCGREDQVTSWYDLFLTSSKKKGDKSRTWVYCDLDWAEYAGFIEKNQGR